MIKITHILLLAVAFSAISAEGDWSEDPNVQVIFDQTHRNENREEGHAMADCHYIRKFTLRKDLHPGTNIADLEQGQHKHIYYHTVECMDMNLKLVRSAYTTFSYDDETLPEGTQPNYQLLPPGCPPPIVARKPTICENGVKLGKHIVSDVEEILTKQMADNPAQLNLDPNDPLLNTKEMHQVVVDLDSLEKQLEGVLQKVYDDMANDPTPSSTEELPEGVVKNVYSFPNTEVVVYAKPPAEGSESAHPEPGSDSSATNPVHMYPGTTTLSNGSPADATRGEGPERAEPGVTMLPEDPSKLPEGSFHSKRVNDVKNPTNPNEVVSQTLVEVLVTADPRRQISKTWTRPGSDESTPWAFVETKERLPATKDATVISEMTWNPDGSEQGQPKTYDNPMRFDRPQPAPEVEVPASLYSTLGTVAVEYGEVLKQLVAEKSKCLLDQIFHRKQYEIELVCATTATQAEEEAVLENELIRELFCSEYDGDCTLFVDDMKAAMMAHINATGSHEGFGKEYKKSYWGDLEAGAAN